MDTGWYALIVKYVLKWNSGESIVNQITNLVTITSVIMSGLCVKSHRNGAARLVLPEGTPAAVHRSGPCAGAVPSCG